MASAKLDYQYYKEREGKLLQLTVELAKFWNNLAHVKMEEECQQNPKNSQLSFIYASCIISGVVSRGLMS